MKTQIVSFLLRRFASVPRIRPEGKWPWRSPGTRSHSHLFWTDSKVMALRC